LRQRGDGDARRAPGSRELYHTILSGRWARPMWYVERAASIFYSGMLVLWMRRIGPRFRQPDSPSRGLTRKGIRGSMADTRQIIIVGSGAAGLTAAIYAARANTSPLLFEGRQPGGQLTITTEVENYPGFAEAILGPDLMLRMRAQALRFGTEIITEEVESVNLKVKPI